MNNLKELVIYKLNWILGAWSWILLPFFVAAGGSILFSIAEDLPLFSMILATLSGMLASLVVWIVVVVGIENMLDTIKTKKLTKRSYLFKSQKER